VIPRPLSWRPGRAAPWAGMDLSGRLTVEAIASAVAAHGPGRPPAVAIPGSRRAAVLVALLPGPEGAEVVLTRRSVTLSSHRGEIAFPGGRIEPGEDAVTAALREAHEEVGLDPALATVVGELDHLSTIVSRSVIVPVVATLERGPTLRADTTEVDRIFTVALATLAAVETFHEERWGVPPMDRPIMFFELDDETVWGATGYMLTDLLAVALGVSA
jgi:8-oxo-dGTP pyrophosphatase MutT (NUDIX family)